MLQFKVDKVEDFKDGIESYICTDRNSILHGCRSCKKVTKRKYFRLYYFNGST